MSQSDIKSKAIRGVAWSMVERYSGQIMQFAISVVLARILTPSEYGLIGMLAIFMGLSNVFIDGGFSSALIQCRERSQRDISTVFFINISIAVFIYVILFICAPLIASFYGEPKLISIIRVYCLSLIIGSLGSTSYVQLTINLEFKKTTKIAIITGLLSGAIGIYMAYSGWGVWALVGQAVSSSIISVILVFLIVRWIPKHGFSKDSFNKLFSFSSKLFVATLITSLYENFFSVLIGKKFNSASLAYYNRAYSMNSLLNSNVTSILGRVSYPLLSQIQNEDDRLKSIYEKYIQISAFLTFPLIMLLCGAAKPIILVLFTEKWSSSIILLQALSFGFLWDGVIVSNLNLIKVKGRSDLVLKLEVIKKIIAFSICGVAITLNSVLAICIAKAIYGLIALYLNTYYTKKLMNYGFIEQLKGYWTYLGASLIVFFSGILISHYIESMITALILTLIIGPSIYIIICSKSKLYAYLEIKNIICGLFHKKDNCII